jgi:hypothetical protein
VSVACDSAPVSSDVPSFVLVHSPLVGPSTWEPVARELERRGREAFVPSLRGVADAPFPQWEHVPATVAVRSRHVSGAAVLVGHSGAGPLLPAMADAMSCPVAATIFVDAFLPPTAGAAQLLPAELLDQLRALAPDGVLPPWAEWFGEDAMRRLVPDDDLRSRLVAEMPRLPVSYFEGTPPVPEGWDHRPCGYVLLSDEPYGVAAADARARGWPVVALAGASHLQLVTDPVAVTGSLLELERVLLARR